MSLTVNNYSNGEHLTESVLNRPIDEIVEYINKQKIVTYLTSDINVTVGSTGADFPNLQEALNFMCKFVPAKEDVTGYITIKSGYVIESPTRIINVDLSWCRIESEDSTVYMDPALAYTKAYSAANYGSGILTRNAAAPMFNISIGVTSSSASNHRIMDITFSSNVAFINGKTIIGSTGSGSYAFSCFSSYLFLNDSTVNGLLCEEGGSISIVGGSFSSLTMQHGAAAFIEGSTGAKSMNIPINTLTRRGIIYSN